MDKVIYTRDKLVYLIVCQVITFYYFCILVLKRRRFVKNGIPYFLLKTRYYLQSQ